MRGSGDNTGEERIFSEPHVGSEKGGRARDQEEREKTGIIQREKEKKRGECERESDFFSPKKTRTSAAGKESIIEKRREYDSRKKGGRFFGGTEEDCRLNTSSVKPHTVWKKSREGKADRVIPKAPEQAASEPKWRIASTDKLKRERNRKVEFESNEDGLGQGKKVWGGQLSGKKGTLQLPTS